MVRGISRREFLKRGLGGAGVFLALPYLESCGWAAETLPQCFCAIMIPNGVIQSAWLPKSVGKLEALPPTLQPLEAWKSQISVLSGLANSSGLAGADGPGDHARASATFLTCHRALKSESRIQVGPSIDQVIAAAVGGASRYPSLAVTADDQSFADSGYSEIYSRTVSYANVHTPISGDLDPHQMFQQLFQGPDSLASKQELEKRLHRRQSVLDYVRSEARTLRQKLTSQDRSRMDEYLQSVREVEKRLQAQTDLAMSGSLCPSAALSVPAQTDFPTRLELFADILTLALQCGVTRVASFMFAPEGSERPYPFIGVEGAHHSLTHHGGNEDKIRQVSLIDRFHVTRLAYFLRRLKSVNEGAQTLLDRTLVYYSSGLANGNAHTHDNLPVLLAGAASRLFEPGNHLQFPQQTPVANLYLRFARAMGVPLERFADSTGPLAG